jgi:ribosome modulation factor
MSSVRHQQSSTFRASKENFMRLELDEHAWNRGFEDGRQGKSLHSTPYDQGTTESWSWVSGYIEGKAAARKTP